MSDFEKDLLYFASPALLGRKQANLFSFSINCLTDYRKEIDRYKKELAPLGISVEYLYCKKQRVYLLVYRKDMMLHYFKQPAVKEFLIKQGYPETPDEEASLYETLCILRARKASSFSTECLSPSPSAESTSSLPSFAPNARSCRILSAAAFLPLCSK